MKRIFTTFFMIAIATANLHAETAQNDSITRYDAVAMKQYVQDIEKSNQQPLFTESCLSGADSTHICVDDIFADSNVQMLQALPLAKEYILLKYKKDSVCSPLYRTKWNDDYIKCATTDNKLFFEFKFDDVFESIDNDIKTSVSRAICKMHGAQVIDEGKTSETCGTQSSYVCTQIDTSMQKFGYNAKFINNKYCRAEYNNVYDESQLRTAYNLNNKRFSGLQLGNLDDLEFFIKRYVERELKKQNVTLNSFNCTGSFRTFYTGNTMENMKDDILTCNVNGKPVDFVFDDLNESWKVTRKGSTAGLQCISDMGGNFDGRSCLGFTETECITTINDSLIQNGLGGAHWDPELETCVLDAAEKAEKVDRINAILANTGITVGIVAISIATVGTVDYIILAGATMSVAGAAITDYTTTEEKERGHKFIAKMSHCNQESCAKDALKQYLAQIRDYEDDFTESMGVAMDEELARLINLINDKDFWAKAQEIDKKEHVTDSLAKAKNAGAILTIIGDIVSLYPSITKLVNSPTKLKQIRVLGNTKNALILKLRKYSKAVDAADYTSMILTDQGEAKITATLSAQVAPKVVESIIGEETRNTLNSSQNIIIPTKILR